MTPPLPIDFQPYLAAILTSDDYQEWQDCYTPTTVEDRRLVASRSLAGRLPSRLKLRVETVKPEPEAGDPNRPKDEQRETVEQWDVLAGLRHYATDHVVLIGKPGSGKSTSLERLLWEEAERAQQDPSARIPVLVKLRRCTDSLEALIRDFLQQHRVALDMAQVEDCLRQGRFLLLLDGWNELPEAFRRAAANFRDRYRATTSMIVSTRNLAAGGVLGIQKTLKMLPLTEPQMREFVRGYLGTEGDRLFQQLQGDRLRKFAETPLLLLMLCLIFEESGQVPTNLGLAFRGFVQIYDHVLKEDVATDSRDQWPKLLRHLAFEMMQGKTPTELRLSISQEAAEDCLTTYLQEVGWADPRGCAVRWLQDLVKYHLIQPNFEQHLEFRHQLIQEYYAAESLLRCLPKLSDEELKRDYLNYLKWTEPVALMLALLDDEAQALRVVRLAMDEVDLMLGARLAGEVKPALQVTTVGWIDQKELPIELKIQCWGMSRSSHTISHLLQNLQSKDSEICFGSAEALLKLNSVDVIPGLIPVLDCPNLNARSRATNILGRLGNETAIPALCQALNNQDTEVRWRAAIGLANLGNKTAIPALLERLEDPSSQVRLEVAYALGKLGHEAAVPGLFQGLNHMDYSIRKKAAKTLGDLGGYVAISALQQSLEKGNKGDVIDIVNSCNRKMLTSVLLEAVLDSSLKIRKTAVNALGYCGDNAVIPELTYLLQDPEPSIRREVVNALSRYPKNDVSGCLIQVFKNEDESWEIRFRAAEALRRLGSGAVTLPRLVQILQDDCKNLFLRKSAVEAIGFSEAETAIPNLVKIFQNEEEDWSLRRSAIEALGNINSKIAIPDLVKSLRNLNMDSGLREFIIEALVCLGDKMAIPVLLETLNDHNYFVRASAIEAVGKLGGKTEVYPLLPLLKDRNSKIRFIAAEAIGKLGGKAAITVLLKAIKCHRPDTDEYTSDQLEGNQSIFFQISWSIANNRSIIDLEKRKRAIEALEVLSNKGAKDEEGTKDKKEITDKIFQLLKHSDSRVRKSVVEALARIAHPSLLSNLWQNQKTSSKSETYTAIIKIQNRCQFYNYEIFQTWLKNLKFDHYNDECSEYNKLIVYVENLNLMTSQQPIFNQQNATIGVNYAASGSKIEVNQGADSPEKDLDTLMTDYKQFLEQLQENNSAVTDISVIPQILEAEVKLIESQDQQRWRKFLDLKRLWNGSKKAGLKVGEHFAENNPWAKAGIAFLEGVSEDID